MRALARIDPRVRAAILSQRRAVALGLACSGGAALLLSLTAKLVQETVDAIVAGKTQNVAWASAAVLAIYVLRYFLIRGQMLWLNRAALRLSADLRKRLFAKLQRLPMSYFSERRSGSVLSALTNDVNVFQLALTSVRDLVDGPLKIVAGAVVAVTMQWQLALVTFAFFPLMSALIQRNSRKMKAAQSETQADLAELTAVAQEQIQGMRTVRSFGAERQAAEAMSDAGERAYRSQLRSAKRVAMLKPLVELMGAAALAVTVLFCGFLAERGLLGVGQLTGFVFALDVMNQGFRSVGSLRQTWAQVEAAADRVHNNVLDLPDGPAEGAAGIVPNESRGEIELRGVTFRYPDGTLALHNVSCRVPAGSSLAVVGPSGAGKSTLIDLLLRFYEPESGQILYDGRDVRELDLGWYRSQIGVVPQSTFLFAGTILDNIRLGNPMVSPDEAIEAAQLAHADGFIRSSPRGLETELGERGVRLSGGEAQRLAIARALARRPRVLLLDEATSNLDAESERLVSEAVEDSSRGRTTILVAHRLTTAARMGSILVLAGGEVVEMGTHAELVRAGGLYSGMYRTFVTSGQQA